MELKFSLEESIEKQIRQSISNEVDNIIHDEVNAFERKLRSRREEYINQVINNICVSIDQTPYGLNFTIRIKEDGRNNER